MSGFKEFKHPVHALNYCRMMMRKRMAEYVPKSITLSSVPELDKDCTYYFIFEQFANYAHNLMLWSLCCFSNDGEIVFSSNGRFPVSLWRFNRQGFARTATMIEGVIKSQFRRKNVPLKDETPFSRHSEGLFVANINWSLYNYILNS